jgi:hypothetical protein
MTFDEWWQSLTAKERYVIGINNAKFVWESAAKNEREACADIAEVAEPYQCADLIRARGQA